MNRREFLKMVGMLGVGAIFPWDFPKAAAANASLPALPVPPLLRADAHGRIAIQIKEGVSRWKRAATKTWGYNGPLLGPAICVRRGEKVVMDVSNGLPETTALHWHGLEIPGISDGGPQAIIDPGDVWRPELTIGQRAATCWCHPHPHQKTGRQVAMGLAGLFLIEDDESDALPLPRAWGVDDIPVILQDKRLDAAGQIDYKMDVMNAAVGWFGDFMLANGALYPEHVAPRGWLRLRFLNGSNARSMRIACGDRRPLYVIASDGGLLEEPVKLPELVMYMSERFEVLVDASDGKAFDLVSLPVNQMGMALPPFDKPLPVLRINPSRPGGHRQFPDRLVPLPAMPDLAGLPTRTLQLSMDPELDRQGMMALMQRYGQKAMGGMAMGGGMGDGMGDGMKHGDGMGEGMKQDDGMGGMMHGGMMMGGGGMSGHGMEGGMDHGGTQSGGMGGERGGMSSGTFDLWRANRINGRAFTMNTTAFDVPLGQYERWIISGKGDMMLHPFHIHGTQFRILRENGAEPPPHRRGLKDVVMVEGNESEVLVRFMHPAPPQRMYMAHCHLLEHEDTGMMLSFTVTRR